MEKNFKLYTVTFIASLLAIVGRYESDFPFTKVPQEYKWVVTSIVAIAFILISYSVFIPEVQMKNLLVPALVSGIIVGALSVYTEGDKLEMTSKAIAAYILFMAFEFFRNFHI